VDTHGTVRMVPAGSHFGASCAADGHSTMASPLQGGPIWDCDVGRKAKQAVSKKRTLHRLVLSDIPHACVYGHPLVVTVATTGNVATDVGQLCDAKLLC
jgi:hypothetical protein